MEPLISCDYLRTMIVENVCIHNLTKFPCKRKKNQFVQLGNMNKFKNMIHWNQKLITSQEVTDVRKKRENNMLAKSNKYSKNKLFVFVAI